MQPVRDRAAFVLDLFDRYYDRTISFLRGWTSADVAEELAQETFLRLLQHPEIERREISVSYLLKVAHNLLRRRHARAMRLRALLEERPAPSRDSRPRADADVDAVDREVLEAALALIGQDERDAIRLIVCEGLSYQHAADALGVSVATVNNWKHRGLAKLRRILTSTSVEVAAGLGSSREMRESETEPTRIAGACDATRSLAREAIRWRTRIDDAA